MRKRKKYRPIGIHGGQLRGWSVPRGESSHDEDPGQGRWLWIATGGRRLKLKRLGGLGDK